MWLQLSAYRPLASAAGARGGDGRVLERVAVYAREVRAEARKVIWPTRRQILTFTAVVVVSVAVVTGLMYAFDQLLNWLWTLLIG